MTDPNIRVIPGQRAWVLPNFMPFGRRLTSCHSAKSLKLSKSVDTIRGHTTKEYAERLIIFRVHEGKGRAILDDPHGLIVHARVTRLWPIRLLTESQ